VLRYWLFQAHWLVGITAGVILAFVGATGALLSFETEIVAALNRDVRTVSARQTTAPPALAELLGRVAESNPERGIVGVTLFGDPALQPRVTFARAAQPDESRSPGAARARTMPATGRTDRPPAFYVDAYTGAVLSEPGDRGEAFFRNLRSLHRWLVLDGRGDRELGRQIVGACTLLLLLLAATGLYLRWPRGRARNWRVWLTFDPRLRGRRFLWHLHAITATWVLVLYLVIGLTGLWWSYEWYRDGLVSLLAEKPATAGRGGSASVPDARDPRPISPAEAAAVWRTFAREAKETGFESAAFELPAGDRKFVSVRYLPQDPRHPRAYNTLEIDPASGAIATSRRYAERSAGDRLLASVFPLHSGRYFGWPGTIAFMLASLCMPLFAVTGWMLYLQRRRRSVAGRWDVARAE
jgi:sulfite reductase (NADPH) flavoprotein alpha-component